MKFKLHLSILLLCTVISFSVASDAARDVKVFGGRDVSIGEFPYLVYLIIDRGMAHSYACSGGILNKRYIITAAHWYEF
jgi:secreted trypsin-like serine protease